VRDDDPPLTLEAAAMSKSGRPLRTLKPRVRAELEKVCVFNSYNIYSQ
jgi:hypothetical protein